MIRPFGMTLALDRIADTARMVLIAGPTASGKSALALDVAETADRRGRPARIVNADSMQVYAPLRILTARPSVADERRAAHRLYGHVSGETRYSVGAWLADAAAALSEADAAGALPVVVGGTGLYFKALTEGLADTPPVPAEVRSALAERLRREGAAALHAELAAADPMTAAGIRPGDAQRILRALEVLHATGAPLSAWRERATPPLVLPEDSARFVLMPERPALYRRIDARFDEMLAAGALDEVAALVRRKLDPALPVMKATGVRELAAHLAGELSLEDAAARAKQETRRYAKRQFTWARHQMADFERVAA
jgi:tRNA dimethylallyltransferase